MPIKRLNEDSPVRERQKKTVMINGNEIDIPSAAEIDSIYANRSQAQSDTIALNPTRNEPLRISTNGAPQSDGGLSFDAMDKGTTSAWIVAAAGAVCTVLALKFAPKLAPGLAVTTGHAVYFALTNEQNAPGYLATSEGLTRGLGLGVAAMVALNVSPTAGAVLAGMTLAITDDKRTDDFITRLRDLPSIVSDALPSIILTAVAAFGLWRLARTGPERSSGVKLRSTRSIGVRRGLRNRIGGISNRLQRWMNV